MDNCSLSSFVNVTVSVSGLFIISLKLFSNNSLSVFVLFDIAIRTFNVSPSLFSGRTFKKNLFISPPTFSSANVKEFNKFIVSVI